MTSPKVKNHTIECGKTFKLTAYDEHNNRIEHRIHAVPVGASPTPPTASGGTSGGPAPFTPVPPVAATVIAGQRPEDDAVNLTIPLAELSELSRDDVEHVVAYRLRVTPSMAEGLHIDIPGSALPDVRRSTVVVLGVAPDGAGGLQ